MLIFVTYISLIDLLLCAFRVIYSTTKRKQPHIFRRKQP
nr:MAG TPA: hypothetical protein [Caudoviricetes sp.]